MESTDDKDMLSVPSELDTSWADQERDDEPLELEAMTDIVCWILYIDWEGNLEHVYRDKQILEEDVAGGGSVFPRGRLLRFLHTKKTHLGRKYRLMEILRFHVGLEAETLPKWAEEGGDGDLKTVTLQDEIAVPPSLCIFHDVNCLYFLFQEPPKYDDEDEEETVMAQPRPRLTILPGNTAPISALAGASGGKKKTKKVTFQDLAYRYTRKRGPR
jgi:hypothetical protein